VGLGNRDLKGLVKWHSGWKERQNSNRGCRQSRRMKEMGMEGGKDEGI
jgi:hypothetical protein